MTPATWPRPTKCAERLMVLDPETGRIELRTFGELGDLLDPGDVLVVNDAATLPASLAFDLRGAPVELRLAGYEGDRRFRAIVFGSGDHRIPTEQRGAAPALSKGDSFSMGPGLEARIIAVDADAPRLVEIELLGAEEKVWAALVSAGKPVQYAYLAGPLALYHVQTAFASRPWAVEMPSAARPLDWQMLGALKKRGIEIAWLTHGAGLSSTGDAKLDARLPLRERYEIPESTARAIQHARGRGSRVVAIGTSVVRALEASVRNGDGSVRAGAGSTELRIDRTERPIVVDAIVTGMHEPHTSHFDLLEGFAPRDWLLRACEVGTEEGFLLHEFGDSMIVIGARRPRLPDAA